MNSLPILVKTKLEGQKLRVAADGRQTHLFRNGVTDLENEGVITSQQASDMLERWTKKRELPNLAKDLLDRLHDPETDELCGRLLDLENYLVGRVADAIKAHPAYPWFSRIKGVGDENIANEVGLIDIEKAPTISSLWRFSGRAPEDGKAPKREKGKELHYNAQLRTMGWRISVSLLQAGIRRECNKCGHHFGSGHDYKNDLYDEGCPKCGSLEFHQVAISKFGAYYLREKKKYYQRFTSGESKIIPTPQERICPKCGGEVRKKATKYCPVCKVLLIGKEEPEGVKFEAHVDNMAKNKMMKLFEACLWLVWRKAVGLPVTEPYSAFCTSESGELVRPLRRKLGYKPIDPWEMVDR